MKTMLKAAAMGVALLLGSVALAQDAAAPAAEEPEAFLTFSGYATFVSDYRFRGISLSDKDIAIQGSITATTTPGFYLSLWGSSIEQFNGAETEVDVTAGWSGDLGGVTLGGGIVGYLYPGGTNTDYYEVFGTVGGEVGPAALTIGVNYAPDQDNLGDADNFYVYGLVSAAIPDTPVTLKASIGYEDGAFQGGPNGKIDYMVGVDLTWKALTFGLQYIDNDLDEDAFVRSITRDGVVFSITASF